MPSLQREVERLSQLLAKAQEGESGQRERVQSLALSLQEATSAHSATQGRLSTVQKSLGLAEQERRQLQVSRERPRATGAHLGLKEGQTWAYGQRSLSR